MNDNDGEPVGDHGPEAAAAHTHVVSAKREILGKRDLGGDAVIGSGIDPCRDRAPSSAGPLRPDVDDESPRER